jgi:RNA polymerase sigma-70 factor (ECF subfamily)
MATDSLHLDADQLLSHSAWVRALARNLLADDALADDVVQDTWVAALGRAPRHPSRARAWLAAIAANLARSQRRERARRAARERAYAVAERVPSAAEIVEQEAERKRVVDAVMALGEPYREILLLRFWCDLDPSAIARRLRIPASTVRNRLRRALASVRAALERERPGETRRTLQVLVALSAPSGQLAASGGAATCVSGVLAMTAKTKLVAAAVLLGVTGITAWMIVPERPAIAAPENAIPEIVESARADGAELAPTEARDRSAVEPSAPRTPVAPAPAPGARGAAFDPGIVLVGVVHDPAGEPIDGATVVLRNARGEERTATAQGDLGFVLARLAPGTWEVRCRAPRYREAVQTLALAAAQEQIAFTLEPAVMLRVRIVTPDGKPLQEALEKGEHAVSFLLRDTLFPIATAAPPGPTIPWISHRDAFGVATIRPPSGDERRSGEFVLQCDMSLPVHVSAVLRDRVLATQRVDAPTDEVTLVVAPSEVAALATTVRLTVIDAATGQGLDGARIALANGASSSSGMRPQAGGVFELRGEAFGSLTLWIHADGYEQRCLTAQPDPGATVDFGTVALQRAATLSGRVRSPDGGCPAWMYVWPLEVVRPDQPLVTTMVFYEAGKDGAFTADVAASRQLVIVAPRNGEGLAARVVDLSGGPVRDLEIAVRPGVRVTIDPQFAGGTVLRIVDAQGLPLWSELASRQRRTVNLAAGDYTLEAYAGRELKRSVSFTVAAQPISVRIGP